MPAANVMCQKPATIPTKVAAWATAWATFTVMDVVRRPRNPSCRFSTMSAGQERDRHGERDHGDLCGCVERWRHQEGLHHVHTDEDHRRSVPVA